MNYDWPWCAVCGHGVEKVERRQDLWTGDVVYTVYCHGQIQRQRVVGLDTHDAVMIATTDG
jgi:hypothetical protein